MRQLMANLNTVPTARKPEPPSGEHRRNIPVPVGTKRTHDESGASPARLAKVPVPVGSKEQVRRPSAALISRPKPVPDPRDNEDNSPPDVTSYKPGGVVRRGRVNSVAGIK